MISDMCDITMTGSHVEGMIATSSLSLEASLSVAVAPSLLGLTLLMELANGATLC